MTRRFPAAAGSRPAIRRWLTATSVLVILSARALSAQAPRVAAMERLLDGLVGQWTMTGAVRGKPVSYTLEATRVLQRRFVELHMEDVTRPPGYEARVFIGVDSAGGRYLAHWMDNFGAAYSIPPAIGEARGDTLLLRFAYSDGPFRDTFVYDRPTDTWHFRLEDTDSAGSWRLFAEYDLRRRR